MTRQSQKTEATSCQPTYILIIYDSCVLFRNHIQCQRRGCFYTYTSLVPRLLRHVLRYQKLNVFERDQKRMLDPDRHSSRIEQKSSTVLFSTSTVMLPKLDTLLKVQEEHKITYSTASETVNTPFGMDAAERRFQADPKEVRTSILALIVIERLIFVH